MLKPPMDKRARYFLEILSDGRWHRKLLGVNTYTPDACVHLGLAKRRLSRISWNRWLGSFKITPDGKKALEDGIFPSKTLFSEAISCERGITPRCYCRCLSGMPAYLLKRP